MSKWLIELLQEVMKFIYVEKQPTRKQSEWLFFYCTLQMTRSLIDPFLMNTVQYANHGIWML